MNAYDKGDLVRVSGAFVDQDGDPLDPSAILFTYRNPAGTPTTLTYGIDAALVRDGVGDYRVDIDASLPGIWSWRWYSTGAGQAADEGQFFVRMSSV